MLRLSRVTTTGLLLLGLTANLSAETINIPEGSPEITESSAEAVNIPEGPTESSEPAVETINIPQAKPETTEYSIQLPGRGMSMETVQNRFGQPVGKFSAVGEPPITKWKYNNFTVYFESEYVIHAVVNN